MGRRTSRFPDNNQIILPLLRKFVDFLLFGNLFIGLAAAAMAAESDLRLNGKINFISWAFILSCTILGYAFQRMTSPAWKISSKLSKRQNWYSVNSGLQKIIFIVFLVIVFLLSMYLPFRAWITLIPAGMITLLYSPNSSYFKGLRKWPFMKLFLIAFAWAYLCSFWVRSVHTDSIFEQNTFALFAEQFFFIASITLPFDIRDLELDKGKINTLPMVLGEKGTILLALLLLGLSAYLFKINFQSSSPALLCMLFLPVAAAITGASNTQSDYYYLGILDATIVWKSLVILLGLY